jgi:hypothetical protein
MRMAKRPIPDTMVLTARECFLLFAMLQKPSRDDGLPSNWSLRTAQDTLSMTCGYVTHRVTILYHYLMGNGGDRGVLFQFRPPPEGAFGR